MPKGFSRRELNIGKAIREETEKKESRRWLLPREVEKLIDRYDAELVGKGAECVVIDRKGKPEEVAAITYQDLEPDKAKEIFYLQRIFSTLFPHNFPHFYSAIGTSHKREEKNITGTIRQRIKGNSKPDLYSELKASDVKYPFEDVARAIDTLALPVDFDYAGRHFTIGRDGGAYYLDKLTTSKRESWSLPAVKRYMDEAKVEEGKPAYTNRDKRIVEKSIRRLADLGLTQIIE